MIWETLVDVIILGVWSIEEVTLSKLWLLSEDPALRETLWDVTVLGI